MRTESVPLTVQFGTRPAVASAATVAGPREGAGPLGSRFDRVEDDTLVGESSWELAEARMLIEAAGIALARRGQPPSDVDLLLGGDLLNQLIASNFCARELSIPFLGLFGACSTLAESMFIAAMAVDGSYCRSALCTVSSHHDTAERQYRYPTEFANQRGPSAQCTVTGAGAYLIDSKGPGPRISCGTIGRVIDMGLNDTNNMGSAMAAAAADTIHGHLLSTGRTVLDYPAIVTGDLGQVGSRILVDLLRPTGVEIEDRLSDCGLMIYGPQQDAHAGGSGCGCSALVMAAEFIPRLSSGGNLDRCLFVGTGALFSPTSNQQGESIPCIAHALELEREDVS